MHVLLITEKPGDHTLFRDATQSMPGRHTFTGCESLAAVWIGLTDPNMEPPDLIMLDFDLSRDYEHEIIPVLRNHEALTSATLVVVAEEGEQELALGRHRLQVSFFITLPNDRYLRTKAVRAYVTVFSKYGNLPRSKT